jgi:hypothetical protein
MRMISRYMSVVLVAGATFLGSGQCLADNAAPAAAEFYPLVGNWHGKGQLVETGEEPVKLTLKLTCKKVSSGWAVQCAMHGRNKDMAMSESDLMGVDPVTGQAHWYAVTDQGETHDHLVEWTDPNTMLAHYDWTQDGKHMRESITFKLKGKHDMSFESIVFVDDQQAASFSGELKR